MATLPNNITIELSDTSPASDSQIQADYNNTEYVATPGNDCDFSYTTGNDFTVLLVNSQNSPTTPCALIINLGDDSYVTDVTGGVNWNVSLDTDKNEYICTYSPEPSSSFTVPYIVVPPKNNPNPTIGIAIVGTTESDKPK